jgi:8-oxo-dGTP pyrophosphatase MutT (NUDIX family)
LFNIKRELREEAGLIADTWTLLQEIHVSNSVSDEYGYIYLAQNLTPCDPDPDDDEDLKILKIPFAEAYQMLEDGKIKDSLTVIALLKAKIVLGL